MLWNDKSRVFLKNLNISCYVHSNHSNCSRCYISILDGLVYPDSFANWEVVDLHNLSVFLQKYLLPHVYQAAGETS